MQEEIDSELQELLHVGMRVWADIHIVKGQTRAIQVGMEEVSQAFSDPTPAPYAESSDPFQENQFPSFTTGDEDREGTDLSRSRGGQAESDDLYRTVLSPTTSLRRVLQGRVLEDEHSLRQQIASADNPTTQAEVWYKLGKLLQAQQTLPLAEEAFAKCIALAREQQLAQLVRDAQKSLADVFALQRKIQAAEEILEESYKLAEAEQDLLEMADIQRWGGKLLFDHGDNDRACMYFKKSYYLYISIPNRTGIQVLYFLLRILLIQHHVDVAFTYWERASNVWPNDSEMHALQKRMQKEFSLDFQSMARKEGRILKLVPAGPNKQPYGFITPDDGGQIIYFKQEVASKKLLNHFKIGVPVWVIAQTVHGKTQALMVGLKKL